METGTQYNSGNNNPKVTKKEILLSFLEKRETKISIVLAVIGILVTIFSLVYERPEKWDRTFRKNLVNGENQLAVQKLPPVQSFLEYLRSIETKNTLKMWNQCSDYRKTNDLIDTDKMMYDYYLTSHYTVLYIVPLVEGSQSNSKNPSNAHTFSFYAILEFEDDVQSEGEVDKLKSFDNTTKLEQIRDSSKFEPLFESVLLEVYEFLDKRFIIDSAECVKNKLREYMMKEMTLKEFITQDWRFPIIFAYENKLPPRPTRHTAAYDRQKHKILSEVVMIEEDGAWKVNNFKTVAITRWK